MPISRYGRTPILGINFQYGTSKAIQVIREGIDNGSIRTTQRILVDGERLDTVAAEEYGHDSANDWWIIAAASGIGWIGQVPPGTILIIPNRNDVANFVG